MNSLRASLQKYTLKDCGLLLSQPILVGVSGGADSLCLLDALHSLGFPVIVAHFNHHLRAEAEGDSRFVEETAKRLGVPFVGGEGDVAGFSQGQALSIEEAARTLRYQFLFAQARQIGAQAVAVGHNAYDQAETVLMHFLRGAGLNGLKGMLPRTVLPIWDVDIPLVRPLLDVSRAEIVGYCHAHDLHPRQDHTNEDTKYFRNRLRHELIPNLETYNPRFRDVIARTAKSLAADHEILQGMTDQAWEGCVARIGQKYLALYTPAFLRHSLGIQRRLLRKGIESLRPGVRDVDFAALERAVHFLADRGDGICDLTRNLRLFAEGEQFWLAENEADLPTDDWPQLVDRVSILFEVPGTVHLAGGWQLTATLCAPPAEIWNTPDQVWIDTEDLLLPLVIRTRIPGDRFQPFGLDAIGITGKSVKLSDLMINEKIPQRAREGWPLVCAGDQIAWIPGVRAAEGFRVWRKSREVIELKLVREDPTSS